MKELLEDGVNVAFGHDDIMDPWYPMGTANPVSVARVGAHAAQLTSPSQIAECFRMATDRAADVRGPGINYGVAPGDSQASFCFPRLTPSMSSVDGFAPPTSSPGAR